MKKNGIEPLRSGLESNRNYDGIEPSCPLSNDKCRLDTQKKCHVFWLTAAQCNHEVKTTLIVVVVAVM